MWVVDASVAVKWFIEEPGWPAARAVLARGESLLAPDLIVVEASNTAWKKVKRQEMTSEQGEAMVRAIPLFFDRLTPSGSLAARAYVLANQLNHPVYDCLYLALAESEAVELITDDARLFAAVSRTALRKRIRLLAKFES
ncbi:Ribonuclease VapC [Nitrospira tepida]|uniref:Ribonuclease VapC n=1 Tax=Nitrospira tepida TaxID=2973512 RepID=A0AA86T647_9BACT|nr:type II toxin-antitoxin system VapC family toxin [Nitrospira tepida]CAI4032371.1 Ribonuclease VapC [Nitrospira tepida]